MSFALLNQLRRRTIRASVNPMDKSTVVSIYPKLICERKPTIEPGYFEIQPGKLDDPSVLIVGPSSWWREIDEEQPLLEIPIGSIQIADSIVKDYANGLLACDMSNCMPGLFYVQGCQKDITETKKWIMTDPANKALLAQYNQKQRNWYSALVKMADILWSRTNGNPLAISDDMRMAAQELGMKDKTWLKDFNTLELTNCPACGTLRNNNYPVCNHCKAVIDKTKFETLGLKFAS